MDPNQNNLSGGDPEVLVKKSGGGMFMLFGLPFTLVGLFMMQTPFGLIPIEADPDTPLWAMPLFGLVFLLPGLGFMLGRGGLIVDRRQGTVTKWWGLIVPIGRTEQRLDLVNKVTLKKENRGSGKNSKTVYAVRMEGDDGFEPVEYEAPLQPRQGRAAAEQLAKFLTLPMVDYTSGAPVERDADKLDESLRDRVKRTGEQVELTAPPFQTKTEIEQTGDGVVLRFPRSASALSLLQLAIPVIFAIVVLSQFLPDVLNSEKRPDPSMLIFMAAFVSLPILFVGILVLAKSMRRVTVTASPALLRIEDRGLVGAKVVEIPADELEELELSNVMAMLEAFSSQGGGGLMKQGGDTGTLRSEDGQPIPGFVVKLITLFASPTITAASDRASISFGKGLSPDELKYVHALIKKVMTG